MSIKVEGLSKLYGQQAAVNNISFEVATGQIVGFLGPNGAGKSTTMKILTGYIPQTSGKASVSNFDCSVASMEVRKRVGYLPESNPLYFTMYVKEYLNFIAGIHKINNSKSRIAEMIDMTGLGREQHKKIGQLSKGYKQRVGLAQAMLHDPEVLILDEPTSGLDPNQLADIRRLIIELGKEKTVMLSTHIMQEVEAMCDRAIIINRGDIVANDTMEGLKRRSKPHLLVEFREGVKKELFSKIKEVESAELQDDLWIVVPKDGKDIRAEIFKFAKDQNLTLLTLQEVQSTLEQVFQQLTR